MIQENFILMLVILVILCGFSAFFSGSETALMSISRLRLRHLAATMPVRVKLVERILKKPERLIGTILLGNNLVNVAMSAIATGVAISLWGEKGMAYVTGLLTLIILIFAEITPKVYAKYFNERVSFLTAPLLSGLMVLFHPVVVAVTYISNRLLLLAGIDVSKIKRPLFTEEEVKTCIGMGWDEGAITGEEKRMLSRVFTLNDKAIENVMIPKENMTLVDINAPVDQIIRIIIKTGYTRFPVKQGDDLNIIGFIHAKDLFGLLDKKQPLSLKTVLRAPYFVPADKTIDAQLRSFQARKLHQAVVLDERGKVTGLVTLEDIIEELVGSIRDEHDS